MLPDVNSIQAATRIEDWLRIIGLFFLGIGVILEFVAHFQTQEERKHRLEFWGVVFFLIPLVVTEPLAYAYERSVRHLSQNKDTQKDKQIDSLTKKLAELNAEARELEARQADRHLTSDQRRQMLAILKGSPGTKVMVTYLLNGDNDGQEYAMEIGGVFHNAPGWTLLPPPAGVSSDEPIYGFAVKAPTSKLLLIEKVLAVSGYKVTRWPNTPAQEEVDIFVGRK